MRTPRFPRAAAWLIIVGALALALAPWFAAAPRAQPAVAASAAVTVNGHPVHTLPKACWPEQLLVGRDTAFAAIPCASLEVLPIGMRRQVECLTGRLDRGGWEWRIYETYRSNRRQGWLYAQGRTRPGPRVTNVQTAEQGLHHWGLAIDVVHRKKLWDHPRFFYWVGQHAEACGLIAGAFWIRFPDQPHVQYAAWESAARAPTWAKEYMRRGARDSLLLRLGATR